MFICGLERWWQGTMVVMIHFQTAHFSHTQCVWYINSTSWCINRRGEPFVTWCKSISIHYYYYHYHDYYCYYSFECFRNWGIEYIQFFYFYFFKSARTGAKYMHSNLVQYPREMFFFFSVAVIAWPNAITSSIDCCIICIEKKKKKKAAYSPLYVCCFLFSLI